LAAQWQTRTTSAIIANGRPRAALPGYLAIVGQIAYATLVPAPKQRDQLLPFNSGPHAASIAE
jgi:hypothetical protein